MDTFDFKKSKSIFKKFLSTVHIENNKMNKNSVGILVCPWIQTPVPWFSITLGLMLRQKGENVTLIVNDLWIDCKYNIPYYKYKKQDKIIVDLIKRNKVINKYLDVLYLSTLQEEELTCNDIELISNLGHIAAIRQFDGSGEADTEEYKVAVENWKRIFKEFYPYILSVFSKKSWDKIIVPGGLFLESGLFFQTARNNDVSVISYDASLSSVFLGINACGARNSNVKDAIPIICEMGLREELYRKAEQVLNSRRFGKKDSAPHLNSEIVQMHSYETAGSNFSYDVTIFMNVEADTAALGTHTVFQNDLEWITETIDYLIKNTDYKIAIREHPLQRQFGENKLSSRIEKMAIQYENRVHFIKYNADINSYNLIERSKAIIVCTSTIGLESAILGKQVVLESTCYYGEMSFVKKAKTREEYFQFIIDAVENPTVITKEEKKDAGVCYYLTQHYGSIVTDFSPQPVPFMNWVKESFEWLLQSENVNILLECIIDETPLYLKLFMRDEKGI